MTIGKYLPLIVAGFAVINLTVAVLSFAVWNAIFSGVINSIFALGGFVFFVQLLQRRKSHRYEYRYHGRHENRARESRAGDNRRVSVATEAESA
jgi:hypothetical protein